MFYKKCNVQKYINMRYGCKKSGFNFSKNQINRLTCGLKSYCILFSYWLSLLFGYNMQGLKDSQLIRIYLSGLIMWLLVGVLAILRIKILLSCVLTNDWLRLKIYLRHVPIVRWQKVCKGLHCSLQQGLAAVRYRKSGPL